MERTGEMRVGCVLRWLVAAISLGFLVAGPAVGAAPQRVVIGAGSGHISYPEAQVALKLRPGDTVYIAAGRYSGLSLSNMAGTAEEPITVTCDPEAVFTTSVPQTNEFRNIAFVRFENFRFKNYRCRGMWITGASHDVLFKDFLIKDASDYCFYVYDAAKVFDGTKGSTFYNFKWENVTVDGKVNGASITNTDYNVGNMKSVALDFEIYRCTFKHHDNTEQAFAAITMEKCFNLRVHECSFSDIGMAKSPIGHNVCIVGSGYFHVYNNRFTRQWGNDVRVFPMKLNALGYNGPEAVNRFYNNISWEKRKYPMYEHNQVKQADIDGAKGYLSRAGSEVYFNTMYRSRRAADSGSAYDATLVDVYGPDVTVKHNLVIEPEADVPFDAKRDYVCHLGAGLQARVVVENNLVFRDWEAAGLVDRESFAPGEKSPARDAATGRVGYITKDHNNNNRYEGGAADIGAVEGRGGQSRP